MGRHADSTRRRGIHVPIGIISIVIVVLCAVGLGVWWWSLKSATDPIDANPVDAYGLVVSSPACPVGGTTTVTVSGTKPPVTATLDACGYRVGEQLPIQYLAGHPETVRLAGTSTAGTHSLAARLLPIGILAAGLIAVLATIALLIDRRRSRHQVAPSPRRTMVVGGGSPRPTAIPDAAAASVNPPPGVEPGQTAESAVDGGVGADTFDDAGGDGGPGYQDPVFAEDAYGSGYQDSGYQQPGHRDSGYQDAAYHQAALMAADPGTGQEIESSAVIAGGTLFTHVHPEPPEPAGAPVDLTGDEAEPGRSGPG